MDEDKKKYYWTAYFEDGMVMSEENGADYDEMLKYRKESDLLYIDLNDGSYAYGVDLRTLRFGVQGTWFDLDSVPGGYDTVDPVCEEEGEGKFVLGFITNYAFDDSRERVIYLS